MTWCFFQFCFLFSYFFPCLSLLRTFVCVFSVILFPFQIRFDVIFFYSKNKKKHTNLIPATQFGTQSEHKVRTSTKALFGEKANTATSYSIWCWEREKKKENNANKNRMHCTFQIKWNEHECKSTSTSQINCDSRWCANFDEHQWRIPYERSYIYLRKYWNDGNITGIITSLLWTNWAWYDALSFRKLAIMCIFLVYSTSFLNANIIFAYRFSFIVYNLDKWAFAFMLLFCSLSLWASNFIQISRFTFFGLIRVGWGSSHQSFCWYIKSLRAVDFNGSI